MDTEDEELEENKKGSSLSQCLKEKKKLYIYTHIHESKSPHHKTISAKTVTWKPRRAT